MEVSTRRELADWCAKNPPLEVLVLHGSRSRGEAHTHSDWDFAYQAAESFEPATLLVQLVQTLKTEAIDLVDLRRASGLLRFHVARGGILIYERTPGMFDDYRIEATRFWFDAQPVLQDVYRDVLQSINQ